MIKSFAALFIFALLGALVIALPGFAPRVEASETAALAKGDRLDIQTGPTNCFKEIWPNLPASCLQSGSGAKIQEARLVIARR